MCLAVPMRLIQIEGNRGVAEIAGVRRSVMLDLVPEAGVGQYVLVHAGYAIQVLEEEDARETLRLLERIGEPDGPDGAEPGA